MANMKAVNKEIKKAYPHFDIQAFRGDGYVYFVYGAHEIDSLCAHPVSTTTESLTKMVIEQIQDYLVFNCIVEK